MAHIVTEKCNGCKFTDCVEVCPVACFYEMDTQVVIQPDDCIDCMACVEVCPVHAIYADADVPVEYTKDIEFNAARVQQDQGLGRGGNHSPQRRSAHCERPEKSPRLLNNQQPGIERKAARAGAKERRLAISFQFWKRTVAVAPSPRISAEGGPPPPSKFRTFLRSSLNR